jgi:hypothetical protein
MADMNDLMEKIGDIVEGAVQESLRKNGMVVIKESDFEHLKTSIRIGTEEAAELEAENARLSKLADVSIDANAEAHGLHCRVVELERALNVVKKDAYQKIRDGTGEVNELAHRIWDTADSALSGDGSRVADVCTHGWVDARNKVVQDGKYCPRCGAIRAGNETTDDALDAGEGDDG